MSLAELAIVGILDLLVLVFYMLNFLITFIDYRKDKKNDTL